MFDKIYQKIVDNQQLKLSGKQLSIHPPFPRLAEKFPGFEKGKLIELTASSGIGKTKFTKFFCITSIYTFIKQNPDTKVKLWYFALEETSEEFWLSFVSTMLYEKFGIELSTAQLKSLGKFTISEEHLQKVRECEKFVTELAEFVEVIDYTHNPFGIYKHVRDYFESSEDIGSYTYEYINKGKDKIVTGYKHNTDTHYFIITDHISLLTPENGSNEHQTIGHYSKEYCLKGFCKRFNCTVINVHQQAAETEKMEFFKGETVEQKLEPSLNGLANNKETARDCDLVLGLFAPARYRISTYRGYNIDKMKDRYRSLIFLKDRHYGLANTYVHMYFNGASNYFEELPLAEEFKQNPKLYDKYV